MLENNKTILTLYLICAVASDSIWFRYQIIWVVLWGTCSLKSWHNFLGVYSFSNTAITNSMHVQKNRKIIYFFYYENVAININMCNMQLNKKRGQMCKKLLRLLY